MNNAHSLPVEKVRTFLVLLHPGHGTDIEWPVGVRMPSPIAVVVSVVLPHTQANALLEATQNFQQRVRAYIAGQVCIFVRAFQSEAAHHLCRMPQRRGCKQHSNCCRVIQSGCIEACGALQGAHCTLDRSSSDDVIRFVDSGYVEVYVDSTDLRSICSYAAHHISKPTCPRPMPRAAQTREIMQALAQKYFRHVAIL